MPDLKISQFVDGDLVQPGDEIAAVRSGDNVKIGFGTAAAQDVGVGIGDVPVLIDVGGNAGLPVLDGSNLTNIASGGAKISIGDSTGGYLDDKLEVGTLLTKTIEADSSGSELIRFDVRSLIASPISIASGTHTVDIQDGDFHQITATGVFTFAWSMEEGQSLLIRGIDFDVYTPLDNLEWGVAGVPTWTGKDDFVVYRDGDGNYIGVLVVAGLT